jgi:hypothetical protein
LYSDEVNIVVFAALVIAATLIIITIAYKGWRRLTAVVGILTVLAVSWLLSNHYNGSITRGGPTETVIQQTPYAEFILFAGMIAGMASRYLWDLLERRRQKIQNGLSNVPLGFDWLDFIQPLLISGFVFAAVLANSKHVSYSSLLFSYQNGFFWQSVLKPKLAANTP